MAEERMEEMELDESIELVELSEEDLSEVSGGKAVNVGKGVFTTKLEAEMYAETIFGVGLYYNHNGTTVQCYSTGAVRSGRYWYSVCYFRYRDGRTGWATIGKL